MPTTFMPQRCGFKHRSPTSDCALVSFFEILAKQKSIQSHVQLVNDKLDLTMLSHCLIVNRGLKESYKVTNLVGWLTDEKKEKKR